MESTKRFIQDKNCFFDVDGTIYNTNTGIAHKIKEAFDALREKKIYIALNTSRSYAFIPNEIKSLNYDFISTSNGAFILNNKQDIIQNYTFSYNDACDIYNLLHSHQLVPLLCGTDFVFFDANKYNTTVDLWAPATISALADKAIPISSFNANDEINKICVKIPSDVSVDEEIFTRFVQNGYGVIKSYDRNEKLLEFEISPGCCTKGSAVKEILNYLNLDKKTSIAFGDDTSDLDMFNEVDIPIAMDNAPEKIKKRAKYVTKRFDESGVFFALKNLGIINN